MLTDIFIFCRLFAFNSTDKRLTTPLLFRRHITNLEFGDTSDDVSYATFHLRGVLSVDPGHADIHSESHPARAHVRV